MVQIVKHPMGRQRCPIPPAGGSEAESGGEERPGPARSSQTNIGGRNGCGVSANEGTAQAPRSESKYKY